MFDFEARSNKVIRYIPMNENGTVYHTNHPIVNNDIKAEFEKFHPNLEEKLKPIHSNSCVRFKAVENRLSATSKINDVLKKKH